MSQRCIICGYRPAKTDDGYCSICDSQIQAEYRRRERNKPTNFVTYREMVIGFYPNGDKLLPRLLKRDPSKLPQRKTIDLNKYQVGFTRQQIKKLKRLFASIGS